jgi:hypothetical protein
VNAFYVGEKTGPYLKKRPVQNTWIENTKKCPLLAELPAKRVDTVI